MNTGIPRGATSRRTRRSWPIRWARSTTSPLQSGTLSFRLDGSYQGKLFTNGENTEFAKIDGRFLANARVTYSRDDTWKVALEVQNLFDKYYFLSKSDVSTGSLGVVTGVPGLPRTWAVSVERKF